MELKLILEAILFAATKPMRAAELALAVRKGADGASLEEGACFAKTTEGEVEAALRELREDWRDRAIFLQEIAGGWQLGTAPRFARWVGGQVTEPKPARMSQPALETLAVIAYRQPISRAEIEAVRGVAVSGVLETLVERGVVRVAGRADIPGRPLIYETTELFLEHFGLKDLRELPNAEELRRAKLPEPPDPEVVAAQPELLHEPNPVASED
ncbi:MAG: SMC-Scp complex subunit ScpB [Verrucomicrobiia bacterium]